MPKDRRVFSWLDQERFARLSGDCNPIHVDAVAARRTLAGAPIVHGIHSLLWALECLAASGRAPPGAKSLKVQFRQPIYVGDEASIEITPATMKGVRALVRVDDREVLTATLSAEAVATHTFPTPHLTAPLLDAPSRPEDRPLEAMSTVAGGLRFGVSMPDIEQLFPAAVASFGFKRIASLVSSSCVVGMLVPGLYSLYNGLDLSLLDEPMAASEGVHYAVTAVTPRFRLVRIVIRGPGLCGVLETTSRMPPVRQASMATLAKLVRNDEFAGATALVIGGSRGLGELTSKLIASGGGQVMLTYASGRDDADRVCKEINEAGGRCTCLAYDVRAQALPQLQSLSTLPSHLYYFATPPIFRHKAGLFDVARLAEFILFYVTSLHDLIQTCVALRPAGIKVFHPSSSALDSRPANMTEYTMAKAAAEVLCADLSRFVPGVEVVNYRLPRLPTDQTASTAPTQTIDPVEVLLPIVRTMHDSARA